MESSTPIAIWAADGALVLFLVLLLVVVARTILLFSGLWILPLARVLERVPGTRRLIERLARARALDATNR